MSIPYVADHIARALSRLVQQFPKSGSVAGLVSVAAGRCQGVEDALFSLIEGRLLDTAEGVQLDALGRLVKQPRNGLDDDTYRLRIRVRIRLNRSSGTGPELTRIFSLLQPTNVVELQEYPPAGLHLLLQEPITATEAADLTDVLGDAVSAGVHALLVWTESPDADVFTFDSGGLGFDAGHLAGSIEGA